MFEQKIVETIKELLKISGLVMLDDHELVGEYPIDDLFEEEEVNDENRKRAENIIKKNFKTLEKIHKNGCRSLFVIDNSGRYKNIEQIAKRNYWYDNYLKAYHEDFKPADYIEDGIIWTVTGEYDLLKEMPTSVSMVKGIVEEERNTFAFTTDKKYIADKYYKYILERMKEEY